MLSQNLQTAILADPKRLLVSVLALIVAVFGFSALFVIGYMSAMPREAIMVFGQQTAIVSAMDAGLWIGFSFITAKIFLILSSIFALFMGMIAGLFVRNNRERFDERLDRLVVSIFTAPVKVVLVLASTVFYIRYFGFSFDAFLLVYSWIVFAGILNEVIMRVLVRNARADDTENFKKALSDFDNARLTLLAVSISGLAYTCGIAKERQVLSQVPNIFIEKIGETGVVFAANEIGLLLSVRGERTGEKAFGFFVSYKPSRWYIAPYAGEPIEISMVVDEL